EGHDAIDHQGRQRVAAAQVVCNELHDCGEAEDGQRVGVALPGVGAGGECQAGKDGVQQVVAVRLGGRLEALAVRLGPVRDEAVVLQVVQRLDQEGEGEHDEEDR